MDQLTLREASEQFGLPLSRIKNWVHKRWLTTTKEGGLLYVNPADVQRIIDERTRGKEREIPTHLLPALHLFIRAVATGSDFSTFNDTNAGNPFKGAAQRVILVERDEEAAGMVTSRQARACLEEDARTGARWTGRRWTA